MTALATDNFNRANAATLGANWTVLSSPTTHYEVVSNVAALVGGSLGDDCVDYYNAVSFPNDQYSQAKLTVTGTGGGGSGVGLCVRKASGSTNTYYRMVADHAGSNNVEIGKKVAGAYTNLGNRTSSFTDGALFYLEVQGTTILAKNAGTTMGASITDSAIASGSAGLAYSSTETSASSDDWEGGDFAAGGGATVARRLTLLGVG